MPDNLSQTIPPVPSAPAPMLPVSPPPILPPVVPPAGGSNKIRIGLAILILFLISASIPAAVWLAKQRQEVRKEAQGEICCRVMAKNLCGAMNGWDQVASFSTEAECNTYLQNPPAFSYSCNCDEHCYTEMGHDLNQICTTGMPENIEKGKSRCTTSNSTDFRKEIVNQAACAGPTATPTPTPSTTETQAHCDSISANPNPFTIGDSVTFTCHVTPGTGSNQISGYAFNVQGVRYPGPGDTWQTGNTLTINPTAGGSVWCGAKLQNGQIVGGQVPNCTTTLSLVSTPTATPTQPGYSASCLTCRAYDTNWNQITPASIQLNQTVYFATQGSTNQSQGITKARFRINGGAWQETSNKHGELFYIQYTVASARSYTVESMVYNPVLGWY